MGQNASHLEYGLDGSSINDSSSSRRRSRWGGSRPLSTSSSYFPSLSKRSSVSSTSSTSSSSPTSDSPSPSSESPAPSKPASSSLIGSNYALPPLDREYAKPTEELDVAAQLAKKPAYWSAQGWVHRAAAAADPAPRVEDPETRARKFAEAKRELLASAGRL
ncbi:hypothetical protein F4810DRAFT_545064 [Camillea tinctor]|nr:hypothetical protein F4810DRAFT_545064 [Camillea tinctor]